jgi:two-component system sensor histidine kinase EvgS
MTDMDGGSHGRILVAEDDALSRELLMHQLRALGRDAVAVTDGHAAISTWRTGDFSLLLTDLEMPGMSGCELARLVRSGARRADAPIVLLTAASGMVGPENAGAIVDEVLIKPASIATLRELFDKWLGPARAAEAEAVAKGSP